MFLLKEYVAASEAISVWATPDGITLTGRDYIGVAAYHPTGINRVEFIIDQKIYSVSDERVNPRTDEYEYVLEIHTADFDDNTKYSVKAVAYPNAGEARMLPDFSFWVDYDLSDNKIWHVTPPDGLNEALAQAQGGDIIMCASGDYNWIDDTWGSTKYAFDKYVTIMPEPGAEPYSSDGTYCTNYEYVKLVGWKFYDSIAIPVGHHQWYKDCVFEGGFEDWVYFQRGNYRAIWASQDSHHLVVENCEAHDFSDGFHFNGAGHSIIRQSVVERVNGVAIGVQTGNVLATGNRITSIGNQWRNLAWSVSLNNTETFDFGSGMDLNIHFIPDRRDPGPEYSTSTITFSGQLSKQQVVDRLNNFSEFSSSFTASFAEYPYPNEGNIFVVHPINNEYHWFFFDGPANNILQFSDNKKELNPISFENPAKNGTSHYDYIANTNGDYINVVYRNNKFYAGTTLGLKFGAIGNSAPMVKSNIAIVNNLIHTLGGHVMFGGGGGMVVPFNNIFIAYNTWWNSNGATYWFPDTIIGSEWYVKNNIFGGRFIADLSIYGTMDRNIKSSIPAYEGGALDVDPMLVGGRPDSGSLPDSFRLTSGSPAIAFGSSESGISYDIDWNWRGDNPDAGAFEFDPVESPTDLIDTVQTESSVSGVGLRCLNNVINTSKGECATIYIDVDRSTFVELIVYNSKGKKIKKIAEGTVDIGNPPYYWYGTDDSGQVIGSGIYFVHMKVGGHKETKKIAVIR